MIFFRWSYALRVFYDSINLSSVTFNIEYINALGFEIKSYVYRL